MSNRSAFLYDGIMRSILHDIKFRSGRPAADGMGEVWAAHIHNTPSMRAMLHEIDVLAPMPLHKKKKRERGFNQAERMARGVSRGCGVAMDANILLRNRYTPSLAGLTPRERLEVLNGAFALNEQKNIHGLSVCLIDDIFTTGSSLDACAKILTEAGAKKVICLTLARALLHGKAGDT
jgi:ComF family protein